MRESFYFFPLRLDTVCSILLDNPAVYHCRGANLRVRDSPGDCFLLAQYRHVKLHA
jgi:hypothetical protein